MNLSKVFAFAVVSLLATACGQNEQASTAQEAAAPILPPQQRLRCSIDGLAQRGTGAIVWRGVTGEVSAQLLTWTGGLNYTAAGPAQTVQFSLAGGYWNYTRPYFQLSVDPTPVDAVHKLHNATFYSQHIQQSLVCERLY